MSKIFDCQDRIVALLNADPFFNDPDPKKKIEVLSQRRGNIANEVQQRLIKIGVGVIVMLPLVTFPENDTPEIIAGLKFAVVVTENVVINVSAAGTGKAAEAIVEKAMTLLHWQFNRLNPSDETLGGRFVIDRNAVRVMPPAPGSQALLNYTVAVNTEITLN